jgi:hypothetical protein
MPDKCEELPSNFPPSTNTIDKKEELGQRGSLP